MCRWKSSAAGVAVLYVNYMFDFDGVTGEAFSPSKSVSHDPVGMETEKDDEWNRRRVEGAAGNSRPFKFKL